MIKLSCLSDDLPYFRSLFKLKLEEFRVDNQGAVKWYEREEGKKRPKDNSSTFLGTHSIKQYFAFMGNPAFPIADVDESGDNLSWGILSEGDQILVHTFAQSALLNRSLYTIEQKNQPMALKENQTMDGVQKQETSVEYTMENQQDLFDWVKVNFMGLQCADIKSIKHIRSDNTKGKIRTIHRERVILTFKCGSIMSFSKEHVTKYHAQFVLAEGIFEFHKKLSMKIRDCTFPVGAVNILLDMGVVFVGDLVQLSLARLIHDKTLSSTVLDQLKDKLSQMGLSFGMDVKGWKRPNVSTKIIDEKLNMLITSCGLSTRTERRLMNISNIYYVGDLVQYSPRELLEISMFGESSLAEVRKCLSEMGLSLEMDVGDWTRPSSK